MNHYRFLPARMRAARSWRNGGGVTHDITILPEKASDDHFLWRASIATIDAPGCFSRWSGIDRLLLILSGDLRIVIGNRVEENLSVHSPTLSFTGEETVFARPMQGVSTVLNIMLRRNRVHARMRRRIASPPIAACQTLLVAEDRTMFHLDNERLVLEAHDALLIETGHIQTLSSDLAAIVVEIITHSVSRQA